MKLIGITGGVGAGKSQVLSCLASRCRCQAFLLADEVGNEVKLPGQPCYERLVELLGKDVLAEDGTIDRGRMAEKIFADDCLLSQVNGIIHPAVRVYILQEVEKERSLGRVDFFFLEAALLIEEGYDRIVDELWYVYAGRGSAQKASEGKQRVFGCEDRPYIPQPAARGGIPPPLPESD